MVYVTSAGHRDLCTELHTTEAALTLEGLSTSLESSLDMVYFSMHYKYLILPRLGWSNLIVPVGSLAINLNLVPRVGP